MGFLGRKITFRIIRLVFFLLNWLARLEQIYENDFFENQNRINFKTALWHQVAFQSFPQMPFTFRY